MSIKKQPEFIIPEKEKRHEIVERVSRRQNNHLPAAISLAMGIADLVQFIQNSFAEHFSRYGLTQSRFLILATMFSEAEREWSPNDLAELIGVKPPTMTGILDGIIRDGLARRSQCESDRRKVVVSLTQKGEELISEIFPDHIKRISEAFDSLAEINMEIANVDNALRQALERLKQS